MNKKPIKPIISNTRKTSYMRSIYGFMSIYTFIPCYRTPSVYNPICKTA